MLTVEIQKAGFINKGAELMLLSIVDALRNRYQNLKLVMETTDNNGEQPYSKLLALGIYPKAYFKIKSTDLSAFMEFIPHNVLQRFGLVVNRDVDVLIDAAGFAYSSQWGDVHVDNLLRKIKIMKKNNTSVILMPQAFGPFHSKAIKDSMRKVIELSDLVFARDAVSFNSMNELGSYPEKLIKGPDFTNLYKPVVPEYFNNDAYQVCIVPNQRMIDKNTDFKEDIYLNILSKVIGYVTSLGLNPFILVHELNDKILAEKVIAKHPKVPILLESNPVLIKGIISKSKALVGSRFHSLVSGLSQAIPTIGTGWSHKYNELFSDYGFSRGLIPLDIQDDDLFEILDYICNPVSSLELSNHLKNKSIEQKRLVAETWDKVFNLIDRKLN